MKRENTTTETNQKVSRWTNAQQNVERAKAALNSAEVELLNAQSDLAKYLIPKDASPGEGFNIWYGDGLIAVTEKSLNSDYKVSWRKKPTPTC